jgi:ketosteroid isomerase-like protein
MYSRCIINPAACGGTTMQRSLIILALFGIGLTTPASAQDPAADAKAACESFDALAATGDAAKLADNFYTEKAMFIGPTLSGGILIGREAIQKSYAEAFKKLTFYSTCENATALNGSTVAVSGHWMAVPKDPNGKTIKGSFGITFVKEEDRWLAAVDSWNVYLPPPPPKTE